VVAAEESPGAAEVPPGFVIELETAGFASGALSGGLFLGGRLANGLTIGGEVDYTLASESITQGATMTTLSSSAFLLGAGIRYPILQTTDHRVELTGLADAAVAYKSAEGPAAAGAGPVTAETSVSATGFSFAIGPALRLWLTEHLALGYAARLRLTYYSGSAGVLSTPITGDNSAASLTTVALDGTFQIVAVF
jgi:hypothetical protein